MPRSQAAKDRRAVKRERARFVPRMSLRVYLKALAVHVEQEAERKKRNAEHAEREGLK